jgi:hypothetical protein
MNTDRPVFSHRICVSGCSHMRMLWITDGTEVTLATWFMSRHLSIDCFGSNSMVGRNVGYS